MIYRSKLLICLSLLFVNCATSDKNRQSYNVQPRKQQAISKKIVSVKPKVEIKKTTSYSKASLLKKANLDEFIQMKKSTKPYVFIVNDYIRQYSSIAKSEMKKYNIPASIILAQGILESGAGNGELALKSNNHFGIKCHKNWTGTTVNHNDDENNECFRKYKHPLGSYRDHSLFLVKRDRYKNLFKIRKGNYRDWAYGLKKAGYATDINYSKKLIAIIETYKLYEFDKEVLIQGYVRGLSDHSVGSYTSRNTKSKTIHTVKKDDTLYSISKKYNISLEELKKKNGIKDNHISLGQELIVD